MDCPRCGLTNPDSTLRCDCGFDFSTHTMKKSLLNSNERVQANPSNDITAKIPGIRDTSYDNPSPWGRFKEKWGTGWFVLLWFFFSPQSSQGFHALGSRGEFLQVLGFAACVTFYFFIRRRLLLKMNHTWEASLVAGTISYLLIWIALFTIGQSLSSDSTGTNLPPAEKSYGPLGETVTPQQKDLASSNQDQAFHNAKIDETLRNKATSTNSASAIPQVANPTKTESRDRQALRNSAERRGWMESDSRINGETVVTITGSAESKIKYARVQLSRDDGDLDCAGWGLQEALTIDPDNKAAAALLKEIIVRIDRAFDSGDKMPILCHTVLHRESPSPYVHAMEAARSRNKAVIEKHTYCAWCGRDITNESTLFVYLDKESYSFCDTKQFKGDPDTPEKLKEFLKKERSDCMIKWEHTYLPKQSSGPT